MNEKATQTKRASYGQKYYDQFAMTPVKGEGSMKYNENNKPLVCMQTQSTCYRSTKKMKVLGVLWHSTGANNPWLKRYVQPSDNDPNKAQLLALLGKNQYGNDWNHIEREAGLNCWVGKLADGSVATVQTMPWDYKPWGCGGACNNGWIQFEICEDGLTDADYFNKVYKEACEITAYLCKMYGIDPKGTVRFNGKTVPTILCHWDSYTLGLGSGHSDVTHWFPKFGKSMATARDDVAALLNGQASTSVKPTATNYQARVTANDGLNCRTTYSTAGNVITTYPKGTVLTITKEQSGWGYTGLGWVSLSYVEKISTTVTETEDDDMDKVRFSELFTEMRKDLQDNDAGSWSEAARQWAVSTGLINGNGTTINGEPNCMWADFLTREQLVTVLYRFAQMMGKA